MKTLVALVVAVCLASAGCRAEEADTTAESTPKPPQAGIYKYELTVKSLDPDDESRELQSVTAEQTEKITVDDDVVTSELSTDRAQVVDQIVTKWEKDRIALLSTETTGVQPCEFDPPITVLRIPIEPGKIGVQRWDNEGCKGQMAIEVIGRATAPDATGKTWRTWRYEVTETSTTSGTVTLIEKRWFSPELGRNIRWERDTRGEQASKRYHHVIQAALKSYPGA